MTSENAGWSEKVLAFWFGELTQEDWFSGGDATDAKIKERFLHLHRDLASSIVPEQIDDPREALAAIIVFDQFPRNMFRRTAAAFATDDVALRIARRAVDNGLDAELNAQEKQFLYMPFMHSEVVSDQERCVDLFKMLGNEEGLKYAIDHRDIVVRFGRFPHRNRSLGRENTQEETAFLEGHDGYGQ